VKFVIVDEHVACSIKDPLFLLEVGLYDPGKLLHLLAFCMGVKPGR
jgi:hypothetical protein